MLALILVLATVGHVATESEPVKISIPETGFPVIDRCLEPMNTMLGRFSDPSSMFEDGEVTDLSEIFDPFCDTLLNFTDCMYATDLIDRSLMVPILGALPRKFLSYCQQQGIFTDVPLPASTEATEGKMTPSEATSRLMTDPTIKITSKATTRMTSETTSKMTTEPTTRTSPTTTTRRITTEATTTPSRRTAICTHNDTTTTPTGQEPTDHPTEHPTEPRIDCFEENLRTHGTVLKQVRYSSDEDCKKLCFSIEGCHAVVTSPMYWYWTECFVIGEYYLTDDDALGWDTAERTCFDPDFKRESTLRPPLPSNTTTTEPTDEPTENPTEPRIDCFEENLRTSGPVLKQVRYSSDEDCKELCYTIDGCKAVVTSPMFWYYTECFIIGEYTLTTSNAYGWDTAERHCFDTDFEEEEEEETCYAEYERDTGMFPDSAKIRQRTFVSYRACQEWCDEHADCVAGVVSPAYWAHRECFLVSTRDITARPGWSASVRRSSCAESTERPPLPSNSTTTEPTDEPTENPTEPRDTECFKENLRTSGPVLKQVRYSSDEDCKELCYTIDGCKAVVTSPMFWYYTECFIIGEYTLTTSNAYGWDTAERHCFDTDRTEVGTEDTGMLITTEHDVIYQFEARCDLKVVSAGGPRSRTMSWYGRRETWNGDVVFLAADETEMLLVGLHPERQNLAVRNSRFRRGTLQWTYRWVDATYPDADDEGKREYRFKFTPTAFVLECRDRVLITIPYDELTEDKEEFLRRINKVQFKLGGTEGPVAVEHARMCEDKVMCETKDWRDFSLTDRLDLAINMDSEDETYFVKFPCSDTIWFKLFLDGESEQNSHIELFSKTRGNIYCNRAGFRSWYGGERTDFSMSYRDWRCEDDEQFMILEVVKTSEFVELKNRGNTLYIKEFGSRDGNCYKRTERLRTQVWNYEGSLALALPSTEEETEEPREMTVSTERREVTTKPTTRYHHHTTSEPPSEDIICEDDEFSCAERCIDATWRCDQEFDCLNGEDERDCDERPAEEKEGCEGNTCTVLIARGDITLGVDKKLTANNKEMYLIVERTGNLALYCKDDTKIWESDTMGASVTKGLVIKTTGNMALYDDKSGATVWETDTYRSPSSTDFLKLVVQDDNNLVLYDDSERPVWATSTVNQCKEPPKTGDCFEDRCVALADGKDVIMAPGESIKSKNGEITLLMQRDGNLVLYCQGGVPVWHSDTWYWRTEENRFVIKNTGEMMVLSKADTKKWSSYTAGNSDGVTLVAQNDNNLVLYTEDGTPVWHTDTARRCA